jgi:hypothetical protein
VYHPLSIDIFTFEKILDRCTFKKIKNIDEIIFTHEISKENPSGTSFTAQSDGSINCCSRHGTGMANNGGNT